MDVYFSPGNVRLLSFIIPWDLSRGLRKKWRIPQQCRSHTREKLTVVPHQRKALSFFLIYPILWEADLHNQGIHCQSLESISCLFTNLLVIWYKDKVPNKLVFNKTTWVCLRYGASLRWCTFFMEQHTRTHVFAFSTVVPKDLPLHGWLFIIARAVAYTLLCFLST